MIKLIKFLLKILIFLGKFTFLGRGALKKYLINIIEYITTNSSFNIDKSIFKTKIYNFFIYFYSDKKTEMKIYFQRKENKEIQYIKNNLENNSWFIDVGSNLGLYSLFVGAMNSQKKKISVISVEPNPKMIRRLKENLNLLINQNRYVKKRFFIINKALGNRKKNGFLDISGLNPHSKIIKKKSKKYVSVKIDTLINIINKHKINKIGCVKIDTEGSENNILRSYFNKKNQNLIYPKLMIIEHNKDKKYRFLHDFIISQGYNVTLKTNSNYIYKMN